ncbi:MAG: hypothetical protein FD152_1214, partial [Xanthobacteraceae bacterium]
NDIVTGGSGERVEEPAAGRTGAFNARLSAGGADRDDHGSGRLGHGKTSVMAGRSAPDVHGPALMVETRHSASPARPPCSPPDSVHQQQFRAAGLLARDSMPAPTFPAQKPVVSRGLLVAYSCGGSCGIGPGSPDRIPVSPSREGTAHGSDVPHSRPRLKRPVRQGRSRASGPARRCLPLRPPGPVRSVRRDAG